MALLDTLKEKFNQLVTAWWNAVSAATNAVQNFFVPEVAVSRSTWATATSNPNTQFEWRPTPWRVSQWTQDVTWTSLDPNLANNANNFLDQAKQIFQPQEQQDEPELVLPEQLPPTGAAAVNDAFLPVETPLDTLPVAAQEAAQQLPQIIPAESLADPIQETPAPITEQPITPPEPIQNETSFWDDVRSGFNEIWDAISTYFDVRDEKRELYGKYNIKQLSVTWQEDIPALSNSDITEINSKLQYAKPEEKQKILTDAGIIATPQSFEQFSKEYSDYAVAKWQEAVINKEEYLKKKFGEAGNKRIKDDIAAFDAIDNKFATETQNIVKQAFEDGEKFTWSFSQVMNALQKFNDTWAQERNFYREQVYNMGIKKEQFVKDNPAQAAAVNASYNNSVKLIQQLAVRDTEVRKMYFEEIAKWLDNTKADEAVQNRIKALWFAGINEYLNQDVPDYWTTGLTKAFDATVKTMSPKDVASAVQNAFNIGTEVERIKGWDSYALPIVKVVANSLQAVSTGITWYFWEWDKAIWSEFAAADMTRITNVDFTKEGVWLTRKVFNEIGAVRKELLSFLFWYKVLSTIPKANLSVVGGNAGSTNMLASIANTSRAAAIDYSLSQSFNSQSTSKDSPIDIIWDVAGWAFEILGGMNAYFWLAKKITKLWPTGVYTFSKVIDEYGLNVGQEAIRQKIARQAVADAARKWTDLTMAEAFTIVDDPSTSYGKAYSKETKISPDDARVYRQNMAEIEAAITRVSEKDPQWINTLLKQKYADGVKRRISLIGEVYKMTGETEAQRAYLQQIQNQLADPTKNVADMIKLDQRVPWTVQFGPYYSSLMNQEAQAVYNQVFDTWLRTPLEVENAITKALGDRFNAAGVFSADDMSKISSSVSEDFPWIKEVFENPAYFDEVDWGFVLNKDWLEKLKIEDTRDIIQRAISGTKDSDSFFSMIKDVENIDQSLMEEARRTGAFDNLAKVLARVVC